MRKMYSKNQIIELINQYAPTPVVTPTEHSIRIGYAVENEEESFDAVYVRLDLNVMKDTVFNDWEELCSFLHHNTLSIMYGSANGETAEGALSDAQDSEPNYGYLNFLYPAGGGVGYDVLITTLSGSEIMTISGAATLNIFSDQII